MFLYIQYTIREKLCFQLTNKNHFSRGYYIPFFFFYLVKLGTAEVQSLSLIDSVQRHEVQLIEALVVYTLYSFMRNN